MEELRCGGGRDEGRGGRKGRRIEGEERVRTEHDVDAEVVAADEPVDAVQLVRLEVGGDPEVGGGEAGRMGASVGGEDEVGGGEEAALVGGRRRHWGGAGSREKKMENESGELGIVGATWKTRRLREMEFIFAVSVRPGLAW